MTDRQAHRVRLMRAILQAIEDIPPLEGETNGALETYDTVEALIGSLAFILAISPLAATPRTLRAYCREVAEQLRRKTEAVHASTLSASAAPRSTPRH